MQETTNAIKVHFLTQNALRFKVGSRHYIINFPFESDGKKIELPGKSSYNLEEMLSENIEELFTMSEEALEERVTALKEKNKPKTRAKQRRSLWIR